MPRSKPILVDILCRLPDNDFVKKSKNLVKGCETSENTKNAILWEILMLIFFTMATIFLIRRVQKTENPYTVELKNI